MMNNVISIYVAIAISICYLPSSIQQPQPTYTSGSPQYQTRPYNQQFNFNPLVEQQCSNTNPSLIQPSDIDDLTGTWYLGSIPKSLILDGKDNFCNYKFMFGERCNVAKLRIERILNGAVCGLNVQNGPGTLPHFNFLSFGEDPSGRVYYLQEQVVLTSSINHVYISSTANIMQADKSMRAVPFKNILQVKSVTENYKMAIVQADFSSYMAIQICGITQNPSILVFVRPAVYFGTDNSNDINQILNQLSSSYNIFDNIQVNGKFTVVPERISSYQDMVVRATGFCTKSNPY